MDQKSGEHLVYATIGLINSNYGVISNENGEFFFNIHNAFINDTIVISYIGYAPFHIVSSQIIPDSNYIIYLKPLTYNINQVWITAKKDKFNSKRIVRKAIKKIPDNYPQSQYQISGYFRNYISHNDQYLNFKEAALIITDTGFFSNDYIKSKVEIEQVRLNLSIQIDTLLIKNYYNTGKYVPYANISGKNDFTLLFLNNPIRNYKQTTFSYVDRLNRDFVKNHKFNLVSITKVDSSWVYNISINKVIRFGSIYNRRVYTINGNIYINAKTFEIIKFEYNVNTVTPQYEGRFFDFIVEYKKIQDKMYLNYISLMNYFQIDTGIINIEQYKNADDKFYQFREFFTNEIITVPEEFRKTGCKMNKGISLLKQKFIYKKYFWNYYNYPRNNVLKE